MDPKELQRNWVSALWTRLVGFLESWALVEEVPDGLEVTFEEPRLGTRTVRIVLTPEGWASIVSMMWGSDVPGACEAEVRTPLLALRVDQGFLVHADYRLYPSTEPELQDDLWERLEEFRRRNPGGGRWYALGRDGELDEPFTPDP